MSKILISPPSISYIKENPEFNYLIGIKSFSYGHDVILSVNDLTKLLEDNLNIFISLNKLIYESELDTLTKTLLNLSKLPIKGIFFEDMSVLELNNELGLKLNLIAAGAHYITNYEVINQLVKKGASGVKISPDITLDEIKEITAYSNTVLYLDVFKRLPLFVSKRPLISNYLKTLDKKLTKDNYEIISDQNFNYPIIETKQLTIVLNHFIMNLINELNIFKKLGINYLIITSFGIKEDIFNQGVTALLNEDKLKLDNTNTGFLYNKAIYKVGDIDD